MSNKKRKTSTSDVAPAADTAAGPAPGKTSLVDGFKKWFDDTMPKQGTDKPYEDDETKRARAEKQAKKEAPLLSVARERENAGGGTQRDKAWFDLEKGSLGASSTVENDGQKRTRSVDFAKGELSRKAGDDASTVTETAKIGDGALSYARTKSTESELWWDKTKNDELTITAGLSATKETGLGKSLGASTQSSLRRGDKKDGWTEKEERDLTLTVGDKGAAAKLTTSDSVKDKHLNGKVKTSADGAITVEVVEPEPYDDPPLYHVVTTLHAGFGASATAGAEKKAEDGSGSISGSITGGAKASGTLVYKHAMSKDETRAYLASIDDKNESAYPEFELLADLRAAVFGEGNARNAAAASLLGSPGAAGQIKPGDSVELTLSLGGSLGGSLGAAGDGAGASLGYERGRDDERTVKVSGRPDGKVKVTIGFSEKATSKASGSLTAESVTLGGGRATSAKAGESREYVLDPKAPDYAHCYERVLAVWSVKALGELDQDAALKAHLEKHSWSKDTSATGSGNVSVRGVGLPGANKEFAAQTLTQDKNGWSGSFTGGQKDDTGFSAGARFFQHNVTSTATAKVDTSGAMSADLDSEPARSDGWRTLLEAPATVKQWAGYDENKEGNARDLVAAVLAKTPAERATELAERTYSRLHRFHLNEGDLDALVERAHDEHRWMSCVKTASALAGMRSLRLALLCGEPDPEVQLVPSADDFHEQRVRAVKLFRARSLADFMQHTGQAGMEAITHALRHWGENSLHASTGRDLGRRKEWPEALEIDRRAYEAMVREIESVEVTYAGLVGKPNARTSGDHVHQVLKRGLDRVANAIRACAEIYNERTRAEMLDEVGWYQTIAETLHREFLERLGAVPAPRDDSGGRDEPPQPIEARKSEVRLAPERVRTLLAELRGMQVSEASLFERAAAAINGGDRGAALHALDEMRELYDFWHARSEELGQASMWANDTKAAGPRPDVDRMIAYWKVASNGFGDAKWPSIWKARWA